MAGKHLPRWLWVIIIIVCVVAIMTGIVYLDVVLRARSAYLKAEKARAEGNYRDAEMWYDTAIELHSPPESKWVKMSREAVESLRSSFNRQTDDP